MMTLEAPAPGKAAGRAEDVDVVAAGVAEAALLLAQHAFQHAHAVEQFEAAPVQDRGEEGAGGIRLRGAHLAQRKARAAARDVVPIEAIAGVEGDHRLLALALVERDQEAIGGVGDALGGIYRLGTGSTEGQQRGRREHGPARWRAVMVMRVLVVRMPAVVRHGRSVSSRSSDISACSHRRGSMRRRPAGRPAPGPAPREHTAWPSGYRRRWTTGSNRCRPCRPAYPWHR